MKTVYGPVPSWRLGRSLGIDLICKEKTCSFDCVYCQLGKTINKTKNRGLFVDAKRVEEDLREVIDEVEADVITFSGLGEPTLAKNLGEVVDVIRNLSQLPIAVLTNSSLMHLEEVRKQLAKVDIVVAKLDAPNDKIFRIVNRPAAGIPLDIIVSGIKSFRAEFKKKLALQMMFVRENKNYAADMAELAETLKPDEVQIDTPLRPCAAKPLNSSELLGIEKNFKKFNAISAYKKRKPEVQILDIPETRKRRPEL